MKRVVVLLAAAALLGGSLGQAAPKKEDAPKLIEALKSKSASEREAAARDLGEIGQITALPVKPAVPTLLELVKNDKDPKVRRASAIALGRIGAEPQTVVPILIDILKNDKEDRQVLIGAITALNFYSDQAKGAIPVLRKIAKEQREKDKELGNLAGKTAKFLSGNVQ
jgi:HEAT repeat protein